MEAIRFTNTLADEIEIDDSSIYPPDKFLHKDDPSRQYQANFDISYYITPHNHSLTELTKDTYVPEVITLNEQNIPHTEDVKGPPDVTNTKGTQEEEVQNELINSQPTKEPSENNPTKEPLGNNIETLMSITNPSVLEFYRNKVWSLVPLPEGKIAIAPKWVFKNKKYEHETIIKNKARLVAQDFSQEEGINYDETFAPVARIEAIMIFFVFSTYMNFIVYKIDVKSTFLNEKLEEEVYVKQPPSFENSDFLDHVYKLDKAVYGLKQALRTWYEILSTFLIQKKFSEGELTTLYSLTKPKERSYLPKYSNYDGCNIDRKSTSGACQMLGGKLVCWSAKKQQSVAMSSADAEYVIVVGCCANLLWMKIQLSDYDIHYMMVPIFFNNTSSIAISNSPILHSRTKHIDIRYHFIRDHILKGDIELHFIPTEYQLADIFTKPWMNLLSQD
uniref:Retrovirus-related Pol polyprotein from transposon TNT 1-94 n=1 Tax=Tanacetum cinerariifolium TaxID=118510 RepID=A0A6L2LRA2_TANCI|nr:retrovirus-related Pol polyprotein from transposon TNT 1-94 [Tanacetum cinerariifolium]